jgi:protein phosphatase
MSYRWWSSCRTNTGRQRTVNEDAYLDRNDVGLWVVADGMGGHHRGDIASQTVIKACQDVSCSTTIEEFADEIRDRLKYANQQIQDEVRRISSDLVMGCTVVALLVFKRHWICFWAGDSRAYLMREGRLRQITRDHSVVQEMVDRGELGEESALDHPYSNFITRAVGTQESLVLDECRSVLRDGDSILLCSDGLTKELSNSEIEMVLENYDCDEASRELMNLSLERGGRDNITVAVINFEATTGLNEPTADDTIVNCRITRNKLGAADPDKPYAGGPFSYGT